MAHGATVFPFLANALALDLINTAVVLRGRPRELLDSPEALARWWAEAQRRHPDAEALEGGEEEWSRPETLAAARALRAALRVVFDAAVAGATPTAPMLDPLNAVLRLGSPALAPAPDGNLEVRWRRHGDAPGGVLLPVALSAMRLLTQAEPERLRACENPRCTALFYDASKSGTRRWCGEDCMNRARSAERYARVRQEKAAAGSI